MPKVFISLALSKSPFMVKRQLTSVAAQTFGDFVAWIDCYTPPDDEISDICRSYADKDRRFVFRPLKYAQLQSHYYKKNFFRAVGHEYLIFKHLHARWHPNYLAECVKALDGYPEAVAVYSPCQFVDNKENPLAAAPLMKPGPYANYHDTTSPDPIERFLPWVKESTYSLAAHGLMRQWPLLTKKNVLPLLSANIYWSDPVLGLAGPCIQLDNAMVYLRIWNYDHLWPNILEAIKPKIGTYNLMTPYFSFLVQCYNLVMNSDIEPGVKNALLPQTVGAIMARFQAVLNSELRSFIETVSKKHVYNHKEGLPNLEVGQYPFLDILTFWPLMQTLNNIKNFFPGLPDLNNARAVCFYGLQEPNDALTALKEEGRHGQHPHDIHTE